MSIYNNYKPTVKEFAALRERYQPKTDNVYGPTMPKTQNSGGAAPTVKAVSSAGGAPSPSANAAASPNVGGASATDAFGNVSTRKWMTDAGLNNNLIGYDPNRSMVTYNGKDFAKAASETDGTSYLNQEAAQKALYDYYKGEGKNLVQATSYLAGQGSPYRVGYNNGTLTVGGIAVPTAFVDNGKAWVLEDDLNAVMGQLNASSGYRNKSDILSEYQSKYEPMQDAALDKLVNRKAFTYDPENDQVFQAYRQQYNREGNRSMEDTMGAVNALTGGLTNSAAVTAAGQARQYWSDKLMDRIPELEANAYNRYVGDYNMDRQTLGDIMSAYNADFNRAYGVNSDIYNDLQAQREWDYNRDLNTWNRNWQDKFNEQTYRGNEKDIWWKDANNTQNYESNEFNKYMTLADMTGNYHQWLVDRYGIDPNASAWAKDTYLADLNTKNSKELATHDNELQKGLLDYQAALGARYGGSSRSSGGSGSGSSKRMTSSQFNTFFNKVRSLQEDGAAQTEIANYIEGLGLNADDKYNLYDKTGVSWAQDLELQRMRENGATDAELEAYLEGQIATGKLSFDRAEYILKNRI